MTLWQQQVQSKTCFRFQSSDHRMIKEYQAKMASSFQGKFILALTQVTKLFSAVHGNTYLNLKLPFQPRT